MRDEKEERKKQARSNKQTRQSNTAHPRQSLLLEHVYICIHTALLLTITLQAARDGREDIVRQHLKRLPKYRKEKVLNAKDSEGYTALHYAAKFNRFKILQLLITSGASEEGGRRG